VGNIVRWQIAALFHRAIYRVRYGSQAPYSSRYIVTKERDSACLGRAFLPQQNFSANGKSLALGMEVNTLWRNHETLCRRFSPAFRRRPF
jgi:hypothetical protein